MKIKKKFNKTLAVLLLLIIPWLTGGCMLGTLPKPQVAVASKIYDSKNRLITSIYKENREHVSIDQVPAVTQQAFVAVEDARFYRHFGLDPIRILGALWRNLKAGEKVQGGSTITQQTVKNLYLTHEKTFGRKITEAWLAIQLEQKYSKKQILEMYLNQIYFGQGAYGIETAAKTYFGKPAAELDMAESAMLAGLPKAPNTYTPYANWEGAKKRQKIVLNRMVEAGYIKQEAADKAAKEKVTLRSVESGPGPAPYFANEIVRYITEKYEDGAKMLYTEGLSVYTTLDLDMQEAAEKALSSGLAKKQSSLEGALVAIDPANGYIKAMVGGRDFSRSKFNRAVQAKRQPGSAFKPFLYAAAIDLGYTQGSTLTCEPTEFPSGSRQPYKPTDYGASPYHYRPFTLKEALVVSDNVVSVKLANEVGPATAAEYARKMGIKSEQRPYLSLALGTSEVTPLELTAAYGTLASQGIKTDPLMVLKITDQTGQVLEENQPRSQRVLPQTSAYLITDMLSEVLQPGGTASSISGLITRPAAGKTGTTQNYHDAWFAGYTPHLAATVYIGYDDPSKSVGSSGGTIAAPIWANFINKALTNTPATGFPIPPEIVRVNICADSGLLATPYSPNTLSASFIRGTEPKEYCGIHSYPGLDNQPGQDWFSQDKWKKDNQGGGNLGGRKGFLDWFFSPR